jgi:hypothetical protein
MHATIEEVLTMYADGYVFQINDGQIKAVTRKLTRETGNVKHDNIDRHDSK